jgi:hypothetical protein
VIDRLIKHDAEVFSLWLEVTNRGRSNPSGGKGADGHKSATQGWYIIDERERSTWSAGEQEGAMTSVAMASHRSSCVSGARAKARAVAPLGPRSRPTVRFLVLDDEDRLDDLRAARGIGLGLVLGLGSWIAVGFAAWALLA